MSWWQFLWLEILYNLWHRSFKIRCLCITCYCPLVKTLLEEEDHDYVDSTRNTKAIKKTNNSTSTLITSRAISGLISTHFWKHSKACCLLPARKKAKPLALFSCLVLENRKLRGWNLSVGIAKNIQLHPSFSINTGGPVRVHFWQVTWPWNSNTRKILRQQTTQR